MFTDYTPSGQAARMSSERAKSNSDGWSPSNRMVLKSHRDENIVTRGFNPGMGSENMFRPHTNGERRDGLISDGM